MTLWSTGWTRSTAIYLQLRHLLKTACRFCTAWQQKCIHFQFMAPQAQQSQTQHGRVCVVTAAEELIKPNTKPKSSAHPQLFTQHDEKSNCPICSIFFNGHYSSLRKQCSDTVQSYLSPSRWPLLSSAFDSSRCCIWVDYKGRRRYPTRSESTATYFNCCSPLFSEPFKEAFDRPIYSSKLTSLCIVEI